MPIDSVGCFSNSSFYWTKRFFSKVKIEDDYTVPVSLTCDGADVNGKRFAGKFKDQLQSHGSEKCSIFGVIMRFCSTRFIFAVVAHVFAVFFELFGLVSILISINDIFYLVQYFQTLFLRLFLSTIPHKEPILLDDNEDSNNTIQFHIDPQMLKIYSITGFCICIFLSNFLKSMTSWINLRFVRFFLTIFVFFLIFTFAIFPRTAIRLRNGVLGSMFKKCLKSKISYNIAVHQVMSFAGADGEKIINFVEKSFLIPGIFTGIFLASIASIILLGYPGIWPLLVIFPILFIAFIVSKTSSKYLSFAAHFTATKLSIVEDLCTNFRNIVMLDFTKTLSKDFQIQMQRENRKLTFREIFSTRTSGHLTSAVLIGGLYLNWCDVGIRTDTVEVLVLIILFSYLLKGYMQQFCEGVQAYTDVRTCFEKIKETFIFETAEQSKTKPHREYFVTSDNGVFQWSEKSMYLRIEQFYVSRNNIVGLVGLSGAGKTTFVHSLLGHTMLKSGDLKLKSKIEYYPETPFLLNSSVKDNIIMHSVFDSVRYYNAINSTGLDKDILVAPGTEEFEIMSLDLTAEQIFRVVLARALYSEASGFVFDEPAKNLRKTDEIIKIFHDVMLKLQIQNKTVIIVSCYRPFLEICQKIHYIENGLIISDTGTRGTYSSFVEIPEYDEVLHKEDELDASCGHQEPIEGCNLDGLALQKPAESRTSCQIPEGKSTKWTPMSYLRILIITIFLIISNIAYFGLPFAFIQFSSYKDPWMAYVSIGIIITSILIDVVVKALYATSCEIKSNKYQLTLFEKLLNTSLNYLQTTPLSNVTMKFVIDFNEGKGILFI